MLNTNEQPSRLDALSGSIMDETALNDQVSMFILNCITKNNFKSV